MAEIEATYPDKLVGKSGQTLWETLTCGDTGEWQMLDDYNDNTVTITGTFNSQTVTMQGTNDGGTTVFPLTDPSATAIALTEAGGKLIVEAPKEIRPSFSGSSGGDVDVRVQMRKA